jgi:hypothetical protein
LTAAPTHQHVTMKKACHSSHWATKVAAETAAPWTQVTGAHHPSFSLCVLSLEKLECY